jgi:hypothetical protein
MRMNRKFKHFRGFALGILTMLILWGLAPAAVTAGQIDPLPNEWCAAAALGLTLMAASRDRK